MEAHSCLVLGVFVGGLSACRRVLASERMTAWTDMHAFMLCWVMDQLTPESPPALDRFAR